MSKLKSPCSLCGQTIPKSVFEKKAKQKVERLKESLRQAKERGEPVGRPREFFTFEILNLYEKGMSVADIAKAIGCSKRTVHRHLNVL